MEENDVRDRVNEYLAGNESLNNLANWIAREFPVIRYQDDDLFNLVASIQNQFQMYFDSLLDEASFNNELRNLIASKNTKEYCVEFLFDDRPAANSSTQIISPSRNSSVLQAYA